MDSIRRTVFAGLFVIAASGLLLAGCSDSVLDVEPTNNIAESNVWDSEGLTNSYLNDIYARLEVIPSWYLSSGAVRNLEDAFGGAVRAGPTDEWTPMYWMPQLQITEEGVPGVPGWQEYNPIQYWNWDELRETNIVIENLEKENKGSIAPSVREKAVAEARWMRAYIYFEKVIRYGGVPIIRSPQEPFADSSVESLLLCKSAGDVEKATAFCQVVSESNKQPKAEARWLLLRSRSTTRRSKSCSRATVGWPFCWSRF